MTKAQRILKVCGKTSDLCCVPLVVDGVEVANHDGYVPDFFPGDHYGDYLMFDIDLDTGMILNWKKPTAEQVDEFIKQCNNKE
jgi:hypothetical protein